MPKIAQKSFTKYNRIEPAKTIGSVQKNSDDSYRAEKVMFVIITDGQENASREYMSAKVRNMIERQKTRYGWEFIFLGANIDAVETAGRFGIAPDRAQKCHADSAGVELNFRVMSEAVAGFRSSEMLSADWSRDIQADYKTLGKKMN